MKTMKTISLASLIALVGLFVWGCTPSQNVTPDDSLSAARAGADTTGFFCKSKLTKIATTDLPAAVTSYITATYAGATVDYAAKDDTGNFLVGITQNGTRKSLLFNADGSFNKEFAHRSGGPGGPKGPGHGRDSITQVAITDLPAAITSYITANYAGATINVAAKDANRGYVVMITQNDVKKALLFNLDGSFNQEVVRKIKMDYSIIEASTLPANVTSYITTNYAGSSVKLAAKSSSGAYKVFIQTSAGKLIELSFAADGTFVQARPGRR